MTRKIHGAAGLIALFCILCFWLSTLISELFLNHHAVLTVKTGILWGLLILVPAMAVTGASGFNIGKNWRLPVIATKKKRMKAIAIIGLCIMIPCAFFLQHKAALGEFDTSFTIIQVIELVAGLTNIILISANARDGFNIRRKQLKKKN